MGPTLQVQQAIKSMALAGFLIAATLIIGINFKVFNNIFKEKTTNYWWLFLITAMVPIALVLYMFTFFFS